MVAVSDMFSLIRLLLRISRLWSVIDGHGGRRATDWLQKNLGTIILGKIKAEDTQVEIVRALHARLASSFPTCLMCGSNDLMTTILNADLPS